MVTMNPLNIRKPKRSAWHGRFLYSRWFFRSLELHATANLPPRDPSANVFKTVRRGARFDLALMTAGTRSYSARVGRSIYVNWGFAIGLFICFLRATSPVGACDSSSGEATLVSRG